MKKKLVLLGLALTTLLTACGGNTGSTAPKTTEPAAGELEKVVIGVSPAPHGEIVEALKDEFTNAGLEVEIVSFDDYVQPNLALADGSLDANYFQHRPYLETFSAEHILDLTVIGQVHVEPLALYSSKYKSIEELPDGAEILVPNDPSNGARALILLESAGLIKLADPTNLKATEADIVENTKNIKFTPIDAANIARTYTDVDAGIINANFAIDAGLNPVKDGLLVEGEYSPYANVVVVKTGRENEEKFKKLIEVLNSEAARKFIEEKYEGNVNPVF